MIKGINTTGLKFYNLLHESMEFTSELGKMTLASAKLEANLIFLLNRKKINGDFKTATLGRLINEANKNGLLDKNEFQAFKIIKDQRNYLTHNIYALLNNQIEETTLEKEELLDSDVLVYQERVWQLNKNLEDLSNLVRNKK